MSVSKTIAKNTVIMGFSQILCSILNFFTIILIARSLGEEMFGIYSFALSFTALFVVFADLGMNNLIIREVARDYGLATKVFSNISIVRLVLSIIAFGLILSVLTILGYPAEIKSVVSLIAIYVILCSFATTIKVVFQAFERMEYVAILNIVEKSLIIFLTYWILKCGYGLIELGYAYVFVAILSVLLSATVFTTKIARPKFAFDLQSSKAFVIKSLPFGLNALFGVSFFQIDTVMLSLFHDEISVGIYNAAYVPLLSLTGVISYMVTSAIFPAMSKYFTSSADSLKILTSTSWKYMAIAGVPISIGCYFLADQLIFIFYGNKFSMSVIAFQILALFVTLRLLNDINGTLLTAVNKQNLRTMAVGVCALSNVILNLIMIPIFGFIGASVATVLSEVGLYLLFMNFINNNYMTIKMSVYLKKPLIAGFVMGGIVYLLSGINLIVLIIIAAMVYFFVLLSVGAFTEDDKKTLKDILKRGRTYDKKIN